MSDNIYIVYETTNLLNGRFYIGVHKINGKKYLGSGKLLKFAIDKYGRDNFIRETLRSFEYEHDAYEYEKLIVDDEMVSNNNCYNIVEGGGCPPTFYGEDNSSFGVPKSDKTKRKISESKIGSIPWNKGKKLKPLTEAHRMKTSKNMPSNKQCFINGKCFHSIRSAGRFLCVDNKTIYFWCKVKKIPHCYIVDNKEEIKMERNNNKINKVEV